jgi:hypothetical protein
MGRGRRDQLSVNDLLKYIHLSFLKSPETLIQRSHEKEKNPPLPKYLSCSVLVQRHVQQPISRLNEVVVGVYKPVIRRAVESMLIVIHGAVVQQRIAAFPAGSPPHRGIQNPEGVGQVTVPS